ncbi:MAG: aldo/keto reductase [Bacteroidales bacterium]|nr:aldo/keto reductase [Bacteroidales bacterium]
MKYRRLGKTGLMVSEIGLGGEWLERQDSESVKKVVKLCQDKGINILDCWMSEPNVRTNLGNAIKGSREKWYIQGHIGSTWQNGQYLRTREMDKVKPAFEDLLERFQTDYIDLGMIHYVDTVEDWNTVSKGPFREYVDQLKASGKIRHIGLSSHSPEVAKLAAESGFVEMLLFSINPAYDMLPAEASVFEGKFDSVQGGIDPSRSELYQICEKNDVGITVMKAFAGGRLFDSKSSPFGVALTPVQCIHYALTRPAVASVLGGFANEQQVLDAIAYESATEQEKDFGTVLANAPAHSYGDQCTYCGHCKPCTATIDIAMVNKLSDLAQMQEEVPSSVKDHYKVLSAHASDCIECGACETRCPFGVKIIEKMRQTAKVFGY